MNPSLIAFRTPSSIMDDITLGTLVPCVPRFTSCSRYRIVGGDRVQYFRTFPLSSCSPVSLIPRQYHRLMGLKTHPLRCEKDANSHLDLPADSQDDALHKKRGPERLAPPRTPSHSVITWTVMSGSGTRRVPTSRTANACKHRRVRSSDSWLPTWQPPFFPICEDGPRRPEAPP